MAAIICIQDIDKHNQDLEDCLIIDGAYFYLDTEEQDDFILQCEERFIKTFG